MISCLLLLDRLAASPSLMNNFELASNYQILLGPEVDLTTTWQLLSGRPQPHLRTFNRMIELRKGAGCPFNDALMRVRETLQR